MARCMYCGTENPENARFCGRCGQDNQRDQNIPFYGQGKGMGQNEGPGARQGASGNANLGQRPIYGDFGPPIGTENSGFVSGHAPIIQGTPQFNQMPPAQGAPSLPQPAANAAPTQSPHMPDPQHMPGSQHMHPASHIGNAPHSMHSTPHFGQIPPAQGASSLPQPAGSAAPAQSPHMPPAQGASSLPQPAGSTASAQSPRMPDPQHVSGSQHIPSTSQTGNAPHSAHTAPHVSNPSSNQLQRAGNAHGHDQVGQGHWHQIQQPTRHIAAHTAVKGGASVATKVIVSIVAALVVIAGGGSAIAIAVAQHNQQKPTAHPVVVHSTSISTSTSIKAAPNTLTLAGAVRGTLAQVTISLCGDSPQIPAYSLDASGTLNNQIYQLTLNIPNNQKPGTFTYPLSGSFQGDILTPTQHWETSSNSGPGSITINSDYVSGSISHVSFANLNGATGPVILSGHWHCPATSGTPVLPGDVTPTQNTAAAASNTFTVSGAVQGTLTITSFIACGLTPSGTAVGVLSNATMNGQTYHLSFIFTHYRGPGTYTDPSSGNVTMNFNNSTGTWSTNGSDASGSGTVNSDANSGSLSAFTVPGVGGETGTHVTISGSWSCQ